MTLFRRLRRFYRPQFWLQFLIACVFAFLIEQGADRIVNSENGESSAAQTVLDIGGVYQQLVTAGPRKPLAHYTTIVEIDPEIDPVAVAYTSLCKQRAFIGSLLNAVALGNPAVIVLDKYFDPEQCSEAPDDIDLSNPLLKAFANLSARIPIVTGENVDARAWNISKRVPGTCSGFTYRPPSNAPAALLTPGILNLDLDTRKVPLRWELERRLEPLAAITGCGATLALQAAKQFDSHLLEKNVRTRELVQAADNPYSSFLLMNQFPHFYAGQVLCRNPTPEQAGKCAKLNAKKLQPESFAFRDLNHQIVVIGERAKGLDRHNSVIGQVPGFYLQANYIEAILDDRIFKPVSPLINLGLGFLIFAAFEFILIENHGRPVRALAYVAILLTVTLLVLYLMVMHFGRYYNPAMVGFLAILINVMHMLFARAERARGAHE